MVKRTFFYILNFSIKVWNTTEGERPLSFSHLLTFNAAIGQDLERAKAKQSTNLYEDIEFKYIDECEDTRRDRPQVLYYSYIAFEI